MTPAADDLQPGVLEGNLPHGYRPHHAVQAHWVDPRIDAHNVRPAPPLVTTHAAMVGNLVHQVLVGLTR